MKNVLVVSAHPDDETLGCGGTLLRHRKAGDKICWLITTGISEAEGFPLAKVKSRQEEVMKVKEMYGIEDVIMLGYPTMKLDSATLTAMVPRIAEVFASFRPEVIYVVNRSDAHSDHRVTFDAVIACTKSFRHPYVKLILMYECISETEFAPALPEKQFIPNYFVDITEHLEAKIRIMEVYASELGEHPFPRSARAIEALAALRGTVAGTEYAEAFQLIRFIDK